MNNTGVDCITVLSRRRELPPGASRTFEATDSDLCSTKTLDQMTPVPSSLELKVGAQVMLMKNMNVADGLVNGARGVITSFDDKGTLSANRIYGDTHCLRNGC